LLQPVRLNPDIGEEKTIENDYTLLIAIIIIVTICVIFTLLIIYWKGTRKKEASHFQQ